MGKNFRETLNERMQDPEFRAEWDAQEPERQIMRAIVEGREENGMTQKQLGEQLGFKGKTSDVRMAQYESEARVPKIDLVKQMSQIFDINTHALTVPDIDTHIGLMHTLFALEDMYGLKVKNVDGQPHLYLDSSISAPGSSADEMLRAWMEQADKLENGEISKEKYDEWRYK